MRKKSRQLTFRKKLVTALILIGIIPVLLSGTISSIMTQLLLKDKLELTSLQTINEVTSSIHNYFSAMFNLVKILKNDSNIMEADNSTYFESAKTLIANVKSADENIINVYVGTEKGMFYTEPHVDLPEGFDHRERSWYTGAISKPDEIVVSDPYIDVATGQMVVTLSSAIRKDSKVIGVVGIDLDLRTFSESLSGIQIGETGYVLIADRNGIMIAHPDQTMIGTDMVTSISVWDEAKNTENGFTTYNFNKEKKFASYDTELTTGWKVVATMRMSEVNSDTNFINVHLSIVAILVLFISCIIAVRFSKPIDRNMKTLMGAFDRVSQGDLTTSVTIVSKDEFRILGERFNSMSESISKLVKSVSEASTRVLDTSVSLANMAEETNASINEVAKAVDEVAKGASEQAQNANDGVSGITDLSEKLNMIDVSSGEIDRLSKEAWELTRLGLDGVDSIMQKSDSTMQSTLEVSDLVYATRESMEQINAISSTIDKITSQTNLLALNASIEAARAGENGRGFAVVAKEIRALAEQSMASTVKIKEIVEEIIQKADLSVQAMEVTSQNVKEQVALVNQTKHLFTDIDKAVHTLSEKVSDIKLHVDEIAEQKNNIVLQIENISAISQESASATEEVTASAEQIAVTMDTITQQAVELQSLSQHLQERIHSFKY